MDLLIFALVSSEKALLKSNTRLRKLQYNEVLKKKSFFI